MRYALKTQSVEVTSDNISVFNILDSAKMSWTTEEIDIDTAWIIQAIS